jgi:hypothetical protein
MPERNAEVIRGEIAEERRRLEADLDALHAELRPLVLLPFLVAGVVAIALLLRGRGLRTGLRAVFRFI